MSMSNVVTEEEKMKLRINAMLPYLNEKQRRVYLAAEAIAYGRGGITLVCEYSGCVPYTIRQGIKDIGEDEEKTSDRQRAEGGGRKSLKDKIPELEDAILKIVDSATYGDPEKVLYYTTLSLRDIEDILRRDFGISISYRSVGNILEELGYSKQANQKMLQTGKEHPDRDAQFEFINTKATEFLEEGLPVISVDTKKKENIGNFKNNGQEYRKKGDPRKVLDHDFPIPELGKVAPYGVYVLNNNTGFVNLGTDHDTGEFAAESIYRWWLTVGKYTFPNADKIYINSDGGGSNGCRNRLWKYEMQEVADRTGLEIHISHLPPGTSKWNKVEHRLFCYISRSWQGQPLIDIETVVELISNTTTKNGLTVICKVDKNKYEKGIKIKDEEMKALNITACETLGAWNYIIKPRSNLTV